MLERFGPFGAYWTKFAAHASAPTVIPVGRAVGIKLFSDGVVVVGTSDIATEKGSVNPAKACGLKAPSTQVLSAITPNTPPSVLALSRPRVESVSNTP